MSTTRAPRENAAAATQAPRAVPQHQGPATAKIGFASALGAAATKREVLGVGGVLALQAAAGNRAVAGLVQAKRGQPSTDDRARVHEAANRPRSGGDMPVQRLVGPKPQGPFIGNLEWARWFSAMTPDEVRREATSLGLARAALDAMNGILTRHGSPNIPIPHGHGAVVSSSSGKLMGDIAQMGLGQVVADAIKRSSVAAALIARADGAGVRAIVGGSHASAVRVQGSNIVRVNVPRSDSPLVMLEHLLFELTNAVQQDRHEALSQAVTSGEVADADEYAREKIKIELRGMLHVGHIGLQLHQSGAKLPSDSFFLPTALRHRQAVKDNPFLEKEEFIASMADEVLDRRHQSGSHREVYRNQFAALANTNNRSARAKNDRARMLAGQVKTLSKVLGAHEAIAKLYRETSEGPAVAAWVARQREATDWAPLHGAFQDHEQKTLADRLNKIEDIEAAIMQLGRGRAASLYAWIERHDEGSYSNLSDILAHYLGYHDKR
jgi:hypothetical protein